MSSRFWRNFGRLLRGAVDQQYFRDSILRRIPMPLVDVGNTLIWQCLKLYLLVGTRLTSVRRSPEDQLALIVGRARKKGYIFKRLPTVADEFSWSQAWQLVNTAENPIAKPGRSMHQKGLAYDLSGRDLNAIFAAVNKASSTGGIHLIPPRRGWNNPRLEGGCVHVEIDSGKLDFEPFDYA
ncbi:MAG TPA: hypothetical protein VN610_12885 [Bryobacteraceae bacterium]|nr:hypothetical protein [Bryobacteraceae bacterium]